MQLEPRDSVPFWMHIAAPLGAILLTFLLCAGLLVWGGAPVGEAYWKLFTGAFGSRLAISETLVRATPLALTGLAAAVAFRAKLWNIGGEGQFYMGALAATWVGTGMVVLPPALMIPFLFLAGALAGGLLLLVPTLLKVRLNVDEVVTTLLLNFVVLLLVNFLLFGPWKDPMAMGWPQAEPIIDEGLLEVLLPRTRLHWGLTVAILVAVLTWAFMRFTRWGLEIRAVGHNPEASRFAGVPVNWAVIRTALISGGLAGMAGVSELTGTKGYLTMDLSPGFGYTGIAVAMLAGLHPLGCLASALFIAAIYNGADAMSRAVGVSSYIADVMTAVALLSVMLAVFMTRYRLRLARS
ncbi:ABC transporter permease [Rhodovibrionaceae bacterium A322]